MVFIMPSINAKTSAAPKLLMEKPTPKKLAKYKPIALPINTTIVLYADFFHEIVSLLIFSLINYHREKLKYYEFNMCMLYYVLDG
jgi:hypothetical protein